MKIAIAFPYFRFELGLLHLSEDWRGGLFPLALVDFGIRIGEGLGGFGVGFYLDMGWSDGIEFDYDAWARWTPRDFF